MLYPPTARTAIVAGFALAALVSIVNAAPARADDKSTACDTAAAARFDQDRPTGVTPVELDKIDVAKAQAACEASVAANSGDRRQIYQLGRVYLAAKDYPKALDNFKKASDAGSAMATSDLASMTMAGLGMAKDPAAARALSEKAAASGNAQAQFNLGVMYQQGHGGARDYVKSRGLMEKAAAAGVPKAYFRLGFQQELGMGGPADMQKARASYLACSNEPTPGSYQPMCQRRLGFMIDTGKLGKADPVAAKILFERAAEAGDVDSLRALGQVYEMGKGVPRDYAKARDYYEKGAAKGDAGSMSQLAGLYERGLGVPRDAAKAKNWLEKSKAAEDTQKALMSSSGEGL
jgi:TPR repeat protein